MERATPPRRATPSGLVGNKRYSTAQLAGLWWRSLRESRNGSAHLQDARTFVVFVAYPRSGHGLIASQLDAHPDALVAHELDVLEFLRRPFSRAQILALVAANSREFTTRMRVWGEFDFSVPGQWQGRVREPRVLGDKKGARTVRRLQRQPDLLLDLGRRLRMDVRVIHVVRNPFDTLGARFQRRPHLDPDRLIGAQLGLYRVVDELRSSDRLPGVLDIRHEDFVAAPRDGLARACAHLGLAADPRYVEACSAMVFEQPLRSREHFPWTPARIRTVDQVVAAIPFLAGYDFEA